MFAPPLAKQRTTAPASSINRLASRNSTLAARPSAGGAIEQACMLQKTLGNQAMLRRLQAKLTIGAVNDPLEREADAVAEDVLSDKLPPFEVGKLAKLVRQ